MKLSLTILSSLLLSSSNAFALAPATAPCTVERCTTSMMFNFGGGDARDKDLERRQGKLAARQQKAKELPKGSVEVTFPQKGNKVVQAKQGEPLGKVVGRSGLRIKFDCKNGRCGTCQVRLNGRSAAKVCQGATIPGGATRKLSITLDNP